MITSKYSRVNKDRDKFMAESHNNAKNRVKGVVINGDFVGNNLEPKMEL